LQCLGNMSKTVQVQTGDLRQRILSFVREAHARGEAPSLGRIRRELNVSTRKLYQLFQNGLAQIYAEAGLPAEKAKEKLAMTEKALKARETQQTRGNALVTSIFERLERGESLTKIVVDLKADPDVVREAYEKWRSLKEIDVNQPKVLRELNSIKAELAILRNFMEWVERSVDRRLREDRNGCKYISAEGYCTMWYWYKPVTGWVMKADTVEEEGEPKTVYRLKVKLHKFICVACPSYIPRSVA